MISTTHPHSSSTLPQPSAKFAKRNLGMVDGFNNMNDDQYFLHRYQYYSTHPSGQMMSFEQHLESLDRLIERHNHKSGQRNVLTRLMTTIHTTVEAAFKSLFCK